MADTNHKPECAKNRIYMLACDCGYTPLAGAALADEVTAYCNGALSPDDHQAIDLLQRAAAALRARSIEKDDADEITGLIVRDLCETDVADPDHPDSVCVTVDDLQQTIARHIAALRARAVPDGCKHEKATTSHYDHVICNSCGAFMTDSGWGSISNRWFANRESAMLAATDAEGRKDE